MLIVILITTWLRTQHSDHPALYLRKEQFFFFLSEGFISFSIIAIANFLNNLRQHIQQLKLKETKLGTTEELALSSQSELNALQARINPHFLYNSLNSIASLAQINPAKTEEMAIALSEFYRYSTNRKEQHFHTVEEEIKLLTNYLSIEKNRFGAILQYKLQIDPKTSKAEIPRFLLQPLVENAIKYGFNKKKNEIKVRIKVEAIGNCLHLIVSDSGPSFTTEMDAGYGLRSIKKKLKLLYPEHHEISFENAPEKQVHIILVTS